MTRKWSANNGLHFFAEGLFQSLSRSDLHDLEATNRLGCHFHHRLRPIHACGLKATVVLECSSRLFMSRPAVPEALEHAAAACVLRWTSEALVVALISLSCPLEPLHFLSTLYCFSPPHQMCQGSRQPISCFVLMKLSMEVYRWQSDTSGRRFSLISFMTPGGHGTGTTKYYQQTIMLSLLNVFGFWPCGVYVAFVSRLIL